jgi:hypothetical protein
LRVAQQFDGSVKRVHVEVGDAALGTHANTDCHLNHKA